MADNENNEAKLLEISRGSHKLTQVINSLLKAPNSETGGAFDFEESLRTLRNIEEVSKVMNQIKGKLEVDFMGSQRFERPATGSMSLYDRIDEVKKVIRESSYNSQHFRNVSNDEKNSNKRAPSLVAKLMGLQDFPSGIHHDSNKKEQQSNFLVFPPRPMLDIEMPKGRKLPFMAKNTEQRTKAPADIIQVVKSKGNLKTERIKDSKKMSCFFDSSHLEPNGLNFHKDYQVTTSVTVRTLQPPCSDLQVDKIHFQVKGRSTNGQMLTRNIGRKEVKKIESNKAKSSSKVTEKQRLVASVREKGSEGRKPQISGRKPREKMAIAATTKSQVKLINTEAVRPENRLATASSSEISTSRGGSAPKRHNQFSALEPVTRNSKKTTTAKTVRKFMDIKIINDGTKYKEIEETNSTFNLPVDAFPKQAEMSYKSCNREDKRKDSNIFRKVSLKNTKVNGNSTPQGSVELPDNKKPAIQRSSKVEEDNIQKLLLSSQPFISKAQELFQFEIHAKCHQGKHKFLNDELIFGCATELMVRKRNQLELSNHLMLQHKFRASTVVFSLAQLVEEISHGVDKLTSYSKIGDGGASSKDGIYMRLGRDLRCNDVLVNCIWDSGWVNWVCVEEADLLVGHVEEQILCRLVEEVVVDLFVY